MTPCEHCGRDTPDEPFCTWCGAHRGYPAPHAARRPHRYAVHPGEHLAHPSIVSTMFPHLPSDRQHEFRWGLLAGLAAVVGLVAGGLVVTAIFAAAVLVPVLYLVYLYETQVYRDEPLTVVLSTLGAGAALAVVTLIVADHVIPTSSPLQIGRDLGAVLAGTVLLPVVEEILKPIPAFVLRGVRRFDETVDGLAFGVAVGLGFAAAETIKQFYRVIAFHQTHSTAGGWLYPLLSAAVLTPVMQGSCTGLVTASLWKKGRRRALYALAVPLALAGHIGFTYVSWLIAHNGADQLTVLVWQAGVDAALLVAIRVLLHRSLIEEAHDLGFQTLSCPHCHRSVEAAAFCPHCGATTSTGPRTAHGGLVSDRLAGRPGPAGAEPEPTG
jgi:hypothetical protein